jgi:hypothetical protein
MRPRRPSPTFAVAILALFIALGGTAAAATHFIITSTSQIKPSVLKELRGHRGAQGNIGPTGTRGETGAEGNPGADGVTGAEGKPGASGAAGPEGQPGQSGTTVVARVRIAAAAASVTTEGLGGAVGLTGGSWTQHAQELDQLVGEVEMTVPPEATCTENHQNENFPGRATVHLLLDGTLVGIADSTAPRGPGSTDLVPIQWSNGSPAVGGSHLLEFFEVRSSELPVWEPGADTSRTLTAVAADNCGDDGGSSGGHFTVDSINVDVLGAR